MSRSETRSKYIHPIPYGELGGPFFDPELLEKIKRRGRKPVDLVGFMSAYGLHVITGKKDSLFELLCNEKYGLKEVLRKSPEGNLVFPSDKIFNVARAIEFASMEQQMINAIIGGKDTINQIGWILAEGVKNTH